jgi:hypothetical protein
MCDSSKHTGNVAGAFAQAELKDNIPFLNRMPKSIPTPPAEQASSKHLNGRAGRQGSGLGDNLSEHKN